MENEVKTMKFAALNVDREDIKRRDIQALIFDFDGLLVDTETCLFRAWEALMKPFGIDVSPDRKSVV